MTWDDEAERLTQEVSTRLGASALRGALAKACSDVQRDVDVDTMVAGSNTPAALLMERHKRWGLGMVALGAPWLRAYKARLRGLLKTH